MSITESKNKGGTLTLGPEPGTPFACQATNVKITPNHDETGEPVETLCGDTTGSIMTRTDTLGITAIQDFDDPDGFVAFTWNNDTQRVPFTWQPSPSSPTYSGVVQVLAVEVGGDVAARLTTEAEWPVVGAVTVTPNMGTVSGDLDVIEEMVTPK